MSGLKADEAELSLLGVAEGELFLASESAGLYEQWQVWKPVMDAEKKLMPKKLFIPIEKGDMSKQEKYVNCLILVIFYCQDLYTETQFLIY